MKNTDQQFNQIFANYIKDFERTSISDEMRRLLPIVIFSIQGVTEQLPEYVKDAVVHEVPDEKNLRGDLSTRTNYGNWKSKGSS